MKYKLSEIFDLQMGKTPDRKNQEYWETEQNQWISIADISKSNKYITKTKEFISNKAVKESNIKTIPKNTVIMSFKLSIGKVAITSKDMFSNEAIMAFINKGVIDIIPDYLYYLFLNHNWQKNTNKSAKGVTLNKNILSDIVIDIHDIEKQKEIVDVLNRVSNLILLREEQLHCYEDLVKSRFVEMFGDPIKNTLNWNIYKLKELTNKIGSGATPKGGNASYKKQGISLIRSMHVYNGFFDYEDLAYIDEEQAKKLNNVIVCNEDVLLNITGASVARSCVVPDNVLPARVNQHVCIIRCKQNIILPIFINMIFISDTYQTYLWNIASAAGATRQALTKEQIENLDIIVPPLDEQNQLAEFVQQVDKSKSTVKRNLEDLILLRKSLMQQYFGE